MFAKVPVVFAALFFLLASVAATPALVARTEPTPPTCGDVDIQCCQHVGPAATLTNVLGLASVLDVVLNVVGSVDVVIAAQCSSVQVLGGQCSAQTVCCQGTQFNGLINVGCVGVGL
ncbi:hypothetical protein ONZ45_g16312 [Pleurotus djamor]|nr:hypothetical protein ONZ45_g16312 [Pleurotus djamor]